MRISGTEPSSVILTQIMKFKKLKSLKVIYLFENLKETTKTTQLACDIL